MCLANSIGVKLFVFVYTECLSPAVYRSSEIQRFERSDAIEIHNGIIFPFLHKLTQGNRYMHSPHEEVSVLDPLSKELYSDGLCAVGKMRLLQ